MGLVAINILFLVQGKILGFCITSFGISMLWSYNIKRISTGTITERIVYAAGSVLGTLTGYLLFK